MFRDMGLISDKEAEELVKASEPWISRLLNDGEYFGWFVLWESDVVAGGGILLQEMGPVPGCLRVGRRGHIQTSTLTQGIAGVVSQISNACNP
jgi:hypothetical protein